MEHRSIYVGFDLQEECSRISCFNPKTFETESLGVGGDRTKQNIPTLLGYSPSKELFFGEDALEKLKEGEGILIDKLLEKVIKGDAVSIFDQPVDPVILLERFLKKVLFLLKQYYPTGSIKFLVVTVKDMVPSLVDGIYKALSSLGIEKDRAAVISHTLSYEYYALSQARELWMNDVALFDFDEKGLKYYQLSVGVRNTPHIVKTMIKDFSETLSFDMLEEFEEEPLQYVFENIAKNVLHKQVISTIYINGIGFSGTWADKVLLELCSGRRIFKGDNLYSGGACYGARELGGEGKLSNYIFLSDEMIGKEISFSGYYNGKQSEIILVEGPMHWFEVKKNFDVILDEEESISLVITDAMTKQKRKETLYLEGLPKRGNKLTRIEVRLQFVSPAICILTAKDKGFGDFIPSSNRIWEREIKL